MTASTNPKDRIGCTKVPLSLIPLSAQIPTALAHFDGSLKYGLYNWRKETVAASIYIDAALRHIQKWFHGEETDFDSGIHHMGHAIACLNIILDAQAYGNLVDDRPPCDLSPEALDNAKSEIIRLLKLRGKDVPSTPIVDETFPPNKITDEPGTIDPQLEASLDSWLEVSMEDANIELKTAASVVKDQEEADAHIRPSQLKDAVANTCCNISPSTCDKIYRDWYKSDTGMEFVEYTESFYDHIIEHQSHMSGLIDGMYYCGTEWHEKLADIKESGIRRCQTP